MLSFPSQWNGTSSIVQRPHWKAPLDMPAFEAAPQAYAEYLGHIERREPIPWFTYKTKRGDGATMWVAVTGKPIFDEHGEFQGYYGAGRDVTEREQTLAALRDSEERFRALTVLVTEWYWETDAEHRITRLNGAGDYAERAQKLICGRRLSEIPGLDASMTVGWEQLNRDVAERRAFSSKAELHPSISGAPVRRCGHACSARRVHRLRAGMELPARNSCQDTDNEARFRARRVVVMVLEMATARFTGCARRRDTSIWKTGDYGKHRWNCPAS